MKPLWRRLSVPLETSAEMVAAGAVPVPPAEIVPMAGPAAVPAPRVMDTVDVMVEVVVRVEPGMAGFSTAMALLLALARL